MIDVLDFYREEPEITNNILISISSLATSPKVSKIIIKNEDLFDFINYFMTKSKDCGIIEACIAIIWNLSIQTENRKILTSKKNIFSRIEHYCKSKDENIQKNATKIYDLLMEKEDPLERYIKDLKTGGHRQVLKASLGISKYIIGNDENKEKVAKNQGIEALVYALNDFDDDETIYHVTCALSSLSVSDSNAIRMNTLNIVQRLVALLQSSYELDTFDNILTLLYNMSTLEECRDSLRDDGAVKEILKFLYSKNKTIKNKATSILVNMATDKLSGDIIRKEKGIEKLYEIVQENNDEKVTPIQKKAIFTIWNLSKDKNLIDEEKLKEKLKVEEEEEEEIEDYDGSWKQLIDGMLNEGMRNQEITFQANDVQSSVTNPLIKIPPPKPEKEDKLGINFSNLMKEIKKSGNLPKSDLPKATNSPVIQLPKDQPPKSDLPKSELGKVDVTDDQFTIKEETDDGMRITTLKIKEGESGGSVKQRNRKASIVQVTEEKPTNILPSTKFFDKNEKSRKISAPELSQDFLSNITRVLENKAQNIQPPEQITISTLDLQTQKLAIKNSETKKEFLKFEPTSIDLSPRGSDNEEELKVLEQQALERRKKITASKERRLPHRGFQRTNNEDNKTKHDISPSPLPELREEKLFDEPLKEKKEIKYEQKKEASKIEEQGKEFSKTSAYLEQVKKISEGLINNLQEGIKSTIDQKSLEFKLSDDFICYHGSSFQSIRQKFLINDKEYIQSICHGSMKIVITPGKSGALLFFTEDGKYLLKTLTNSEQKLLYQMLPEYSQYLRSNPDSLLVRFTGMYSCKYEKRTLHIVVMNNVFENNKMNETYDLKGSTIGRQAREGERVLKDLDILHKKRTLNLTERQKIQFLKQISKDSLFLQYHKIMDYSLLLGIKNIEKEKVIFDSRGKSQFQYLESQDSQEAYFIGIIDILQLWNLKKQAEMQLKSLSSEKSGLSSVPPIEYSTRFQNFIKNIVI